MVEGRARLFGWRASGLDEPYVIAPREDLVRGDPSRLTVTDANA
jgi:hypothetical protein